MLSKEKRDNLPPYQQFRTIVFAVENKEEQRRILAQRVISIAGRRIKVVKYLELSAKVQCTNC